MSTQNWVFVEIIGDYLIWNKTDSRLSPKGYPVYYTIWNATKGEKPGENWEGFLTRESLLAYKGIK